MKTLSRTFKGDPTEEEITTLIKDFKDKYSLKDGAIELTKSGFADTVITVRLNK